MKKSLTIRLMIVVFGITYANSVSSASAENWVYGEFQPSMFAPGADVALVAWDSPAGRDRLIRSGYKNDYFQLAHNFQPQANPLYCGIASSVIVLNSMRLPNGGAPSQKAIEVKVPDALGGGLLDYPSYSQLTLLGEKTEPVKPREKIELKNHDEPGEKLDPGLTLQNLHDVLEAYGAEAKLYYADNTPEQGAEAFRNTLKTVLRDSGNFVIVNFHGKTMGAPTDGHISPVAAYDEKSDSVLLLDVAGYLNPWYWAPAEYLYRAMHTRDGNNYRGYLVVSEP